MNATIGLVAVTLPDDDQSLRHIPLGPNKWLMSFDPARLSFDLVKSALQYHFGPSARIIAGIPR